jgi:hypothetical protein
MVHPLLLKLCGQEGPRVKITRVQSTVASRLQSPLKLHPDKKAGQEGSSEIQNIYRMISGFNIYLFCEALPSLFKVG